MARNLSEFEIGLLLGMNGFVVFVFEMPLIKYLEKRTLGKIGFVMIGFVIMAVSFVVLNFGGLLAMIIIGLILMSFGEMIAFPFSNAFAMDRAKRGKQGAYMAMYTIAFSLAHIFAHSYGMWATDNYGWEFTWYSITIICTVSFLMLFVLQWLLKREKTS